MIDSSEEGPADGAPPAGDDTRYGVPPPIPPADRDAWYAPAVRAQYEVSPGVVATIAEAERDFTYRIREPGLGPRDRAALDAIRDHFGSVSGRRPLTREGTAERAARGFSPKYRRVLDRLLDTSAASRRRVEYHALCELRLLGDVTPIALDESVDVVDVSGDGTGRLVVHTDQFAPAVTGYDSDGEFADRVAGERLTRYRVPFDEFNVEVVVYRDHLLGDDRFTTKYAVLEPALLPGDEALIAECKERIWETTVDDVVEDHRAFVRERARQFLSRRLSARNTRAWIDATTHRLTEVLAEYGLAVPPVDDRFAPDRLDDLVYYVLRDYVGEDILTVPIRDPHLEDVEANRVGERVKVIPRTDVFEAPAGPDSEATFDGGRVPTNLAFEDETSFVNVVTQLAAADGTELSASVPSAKVNLDLPGVAETVRCAVALPVISEDGPHVSIRKQAPDVMTPGDLVERGSLPTELVTLLWLLYEYHGVVLFSGPTGVGKTTLMNAHMPFIPYDARPISIDEGSREVQLPHETGVSLTTRDHEREYKRVTMADLMTEANYLNPDVEVIAEINTPASFQTFAETLNTGHGVVGTTHAEDVETLVNRVIEQGLPPYLLGELDLVVFPRYVDGERYVSRAVELVSEDDFEALPGGRDDAGRPLKGRIEKDGRVLYWNTVLWRDTEGRFQFRYRHARLGDGHRSLDHRVFHRVAAATDRSVESVEHEFHRKHRYVQFVVREGMRDVEELLGFLSDLRTDEAATVERVQRRLTADDEPSADDEPIDDEPIDDPSAVADSSAGRERGGATGGAAASAQEDGAN